MKCKYKINNQMLEMTVTLQPRKSAADPRVAVGRPTAIKLASEHALPDGVTLGTCLTPNLFVRNYLTESFQTTWLFELKGLEKKSKTAKKPATVKKTTARKKKNTEEK